MLRLAVQIQPRVRRLPGVDITWHWVRGKSGCERDIFCFSQDTAAIHSSKECIGSNSREAIALFRFPRIASDRSTGSDASRSHQAANAQYVTPLNPASKTLLFVTISKLQGLKHETVVSKSDPKVRFILARHLAVSSQMEGTTRHASDAKPFRCARSMHFRQSHLPQLYSCCAAWEARKWRRCSMR